MGNDKLLSSEGTSVKELGRRFTFLNARWTDVTDRIYERYRHLQNATHEYGEFRALVAQESDWLDKLEKRLKKSTKCAADAEEISEELDVSFNEYNDYLLFFVSNSSVNIYKRLLKGFGKLYKKSSGV